MSLENLAELFATTPEAHGADPAAKFQAQFTAEEWAALQRYPDILEARRLAFEFERQRRAGIAPDHYEGQTVCQFCGPVPIWPKAPARVSGCPWCANRADGLPIPRPAPITAEGANPAHLAAFEEPEL